MEKFEIHDAAKEFPMMDDKRINDLVLDIQKNGLREPIVLFENKIIDGRNRYKACEIAEVLPIFKRLSNETDPWAYVWSLNGERRDIGADVRYLIWKSCNEKSESFQAEIKRIQDEANRKRSDAAKEQHEISTPRRRETMVVAQLVQQPNSHVIPRDKTRQSKATASKTNRGAVERMDRLAEKRPDLAEKVKKLEIKPTEAMRQMKRSDVAEKTKCLPPGKFRVIYADPPWTYNDSKTDYAQAGIAAVDHYPTMSLSDICALDIKSLAADDSVLFLWGTFPLLEEALQVIKAWGFKYKTSFVWWKQRGFNMGHYHNTSAELLMIATKGSGVPDIDTRPEQVQAVKRECKHSEKPEEFRQLIEKMYPDGAKIELFRRGDPVVNWVAWGNETNV